MVILFYTFFPPLNIGLQLDSGKQDQSFLKLPKKCVWESTQQHRNKAMKIIHGCDDKIKANKYKNIFLK